MVSRTSAPHCLNPRGIGEEARRFLRAMHSMLPLKRTEVNPNSVDGIVVH